MRGVTAAYDSKVEVPVRKLLPLATLVVLSSGLAVAEEKPKPLGPGDAAPAFSLPGSDGKTHRLSDHAGKRVVVLAWYPKAFTGG